MAQKRTHARSAARAVEPVPAGFTESKPKLSSDLIAAKEVIRALDVVLLKINCPSCKEESLVGCDMADFRCSRCQHQSQVAGFDLEDANRRNLVSWAKGNIRRYISKKVIQALYRMQEGFCAYCNADISKTEYNVEHIIPISFGGSNKIENLALSCKRCNQIAGAKVFPTYMAKRLYIQSKRLA